MVGKDAVKTEDVLCWFDTNDGPLKAGDGDEEERKLNPSDLGDYGGVNCGFCWCFVREWIDNWEDNFKQGRKRFVFPWTTSSALLVSARPKIELCEARI